MKYHVGMCPVKNGFRFRAFLLNINLSSSDAKCCGGRWRPLARILGGGTCQGILFSQEVSGNPHLCIYARTSRVFLINSFTASISDWPALPSQAGGSTNQLYFVAGFWVSEFAEAFHFWSSISRIGWPTVPMSKTRAPDAAPCAGSEEGLEEYECSDDTCVVSEEDVWAFEENCGWCGEVLQSGAGIKEISFVIPSFSLTNFLTSLMSTKGRGGGVDNGLIDSFSRSKKLGCDSGAKLRTFLNANPNLTRGFQERSNSSIGRVLGGNSFLERNFPRPIVHLYITYVFLLKFKLLAHEELSIQKTEGWENIQKARMIERQSSTSYSYPAILSM